MNTIFTGLMAGLQTTLDISKKPQIDPIILSSSTISNKPLETFSDASFGNCSWRTLFSSNTTSTNALTVGIATCASEESHLCLHRHAQAEIYHVIEGKGIITIDKVEHVVEKGSVIYIPSDAEHGIRNTEIDQELKWLYVFPTDSFEDVKYRFSSPIERN